MGINQFWIELDNGRRLTNSDPEFQKHLPVSAKMLNAIDQDDDPSSVVAAIAFAVVELEAKGVKFEASAND